MSKQKPKVDDYWEAVRLAKEKRKRMARADAVKAWLAEHTVETLALIIAIIALIRTF